MCSHRLVNWKLCRLSIIILISTIYLAAIISIILCCTEAPLPTPKGGFDQFESSGASSQPDEHHQRHNDHLNQTVSMGMRKLIDADENAELGWRGTVIKWSKFAAHKTSSARLKRSSWRNTSIVPQTKARDECGGGGVSSSGARSSSAHEKSRPLFTSNDLMTNKTPAATQHNGNKRIYNGHLAKPNKYPWVAQIKIFKGALFEKSLCSGSIVSEWLIMTAAHCVSSCVNRKPTLIDPNMISALIGRHEISWWSLNIASSDVLFRAIIAPSDIDPCKPRIETDYVLLVTSNRMDLRQGYVSRVCLPERDDIKLDNIKGTIVGWGETYAGSGRSNILRWAEVIIQARELCRSAQPDLDPNKTLCALGDSGACQGDSGGPLMIKDQLDRWVQVGIYSAYVGNGGKCGPNMLMLFKRISSYWRWAIDTFNINELLDMNHIA